MLPVCVRNKADTFSKVKGFDSLLQASNQALTPEDPGDLVLVNQGSHVDKKEKTFVKGVEGKTRVRRVLDSTQIWELLDEGIDMWVAVNGKRVDMNDIMAKIGIRDQDTIRCYGRLLGEEGGGGAQRFRQPPQDIPGQWTCSQCGQERVWPTKVLCFRCGNPKNHDLTISPKMITVLTRYRPIVLELI